MESDYDMKYWYLASCMGEVVVGRKTLWGPPFFLFSSLLFSSLLLLDSCPFFPVLAFYFPPGLSFQACKDPRYQGTLLYLQMHKKTKNKYGDIHLTLMMMDREKKEKMYKKKSFCPCVWKMEECKEVIELKGIWWKKKKARSCFFWYECKRN